MASMFATDTGTQRSGGVNVSTFERWPSAVGGGALLALGLRRGHFRSPVGIGLILLAAHQVYRGVTGRDRVYRALRINTASWGRRGGVPGAGSIKVAKSVTINKAPDELYRFWRNFENLPRIMDHVESVQTTGDRRSHWVAKAPGGMTVAWDAEITDERENEMIAWRSLPNADVDNAGTVRFQPAPGGRGTEVHVSLEYNPPGGILGAGVAKIWGEEPAQQVEDDLRRFKQLMETGEIPTTEGQPSGRET